MLGRVGAAGSASSLSAGSPASGAATAALSGREWAGKASASAALTGLGRVGSASSAASASSASSSPTCAAKAFAKESKTKSWTGCVSAGVGFALLANCFTAARRRFAWSCRRPSSSASCVKGKEWRPQASTATRWLVARSVS